MKIAFLGRPDLDHYFACTDLPELGDKSFVSEAGLHLGGMVINAAIIGRSLGCVCSLVYSVSDYEDSTNFIMGELEHLHIQTGYLTVSDRKNTKCIIITSSGERIIYVVKNDAYPLVSISKAQERHLLTRDFIYTTIADLELIKDFLPLCQSISKSPTKLFIDCDNLIHDKHLKLLQYADIVSINQFGYQKLTELGHSAVELQKTYQLDYLLVTHGSKGVTLYCFDGRILKQAAFPVEVTDTTGAGDSFNMSFIYAVHHGLAADQSLKLACAVAAHGIQQHGTHYEVDLNQIASEFQLSENLRQNLAGP